MVSKEGTRIGWYTFAIASSSIVLLALGPPFIARGLILAGSATSALCIYLLMDARSLRSRLFEDYRKWWETHAQWYRVTMWSWAIPLGMGVIIGITIVAVGLWLLFS